MLALHCSVSRAAPEHLACVCTAELSWRLIACLPCNAACREQLSHVWLVCACGFIVVLHCMAALTLSLFLHKGCWADQRASTRALSFVHIQADGSKRQVHTRLLTHTHSGWWSRSAHLYAPFHPYTHRLVAQVDASMRAFSPMHTQAGGVHRRVHVVQINASMEEHAALILASQPSTPVGTPVKAPAMPRTGSTPCGPPAAFPGMLPQTPLRCAAAAAAAVVCICWSLLSRACKAESMPRMKGSTPYGPPAAFPDRNHF